MSRGPLAGSIGEDGERAGLLPCPALAFSGLYAARPAVGGDAEEAQAHAGVLVGVGFHQPGQGADDGDAELFGELALQGGKGSFAGFGFAAGKFPVAGVGFVLRGGRIGGIRRVCW